MANKFDPMKHMEFVQNDLLRIMPAFAPDEENASSVPAYIKGRIGLLVRCFWFGSAEAARPKLAEIVRWMECRTLPDLGSFQSIWWQSLGLCRWLARDEPATAEFARSVHVEWSGWEQATTSQAAEDRRERQDYLGERLVMCLTANEPAFGSRFYEAARIRPPFKFGRSVLEYGRWASDYLVQGHSRDEMFVAKGEAMFRETFLPFFQPSSSWLEATLWLKAIYFDSGVTKTAEGTIWRAYDSMPGIPRPDFVRR